MSEKMTERNKAIIVNIALGAGLIWCYFIGYPPKIILGCGVFLFALLNILMYLKRRQAAATRH